VSATIKSLTVLRKKEGKNALSTLPVAGSGGKAKLKLRGGKLLGAYLPKPLSFKKDSDGKDQASLGGDETLFELNLENDVKSHRWVGDTELEITAGDGLVLENSTSASLNV